MSLALRLSQVLTFHFWLLWSSALAGIVAVSIAIHRAAPRAGGGRAEEQRPKAGPLLAICSAAFLLLYLGFMFWNEDFAYQDGHSFTEFSAIGIARPPSIWVGAGRFWPLGYQEYNLIAHLSRTAPAYLAYGAVQLVVGLCLLYRTMPGKAPLLRLFTLAVLMLAPAFAADFAELTYADRNVTFALCVLVFCVARYDERPALRWMIPALVASYCALYCKETSAALFGGFAAARLLLAASRDGWRRALRSPLEIGIVLAALCYGTELAIVLSPAGRSNYVAQSSVGRGTAAFRYLTADPLLAAFLIAFTLHVVGTLRRGLRFDRFWDALAAAGAMHFCAVAFTGMEEDYLMGPTELVAALTLVRLVPAWWSGRPRLRPALAGLAGALTVATVAFGTWRLIQRKNVVGQTRRLASFLVDYHRGHEEARLYLRADRGLIMNFVSYLEYRGLPVERRGKERPAGAIEVAGDAPFADDLCVDFTSFVCRHDALRPGDLLVRLPEEHWVPPPSGTRQEPLFEVSPAGFFPALRPLLAALHRLGPTLNGVYRGDPLRDDWLRVSVSEVVTPG